MKPSAPVASIVLYMALCFSGTIAASTVDDSGYSIRSITGEMPIRNVIVERAGEHFTAFLAYQFDCANQKSSQTGFYSSAEAARAELAHTMLTQTIHTSLSEQARLAACEPSSTVGASENNQLPNAS